jgi:catechol 2,3-dioxygenase-like lactoylglutathione lyase family enzyme
MDSNNAVRVRYLVDDVQAAVDFYTTHLGFTVDMNMAPAIAQVARGTMRLLLSGPNTSGARATPDDLKVAGRNRIELVLDDLDAEVDRLRSAGLSFLGHDFAKISGFMGQFGRRRRSRRAAGRTRSDLVLSFVGGWSKSLVRSGTSALSSLPASRAR